MRREIQIAGGGPAGAAAAIAALAEGIAAHIVERARAPRHKVCGEFIPAEACEVLAALGAWDEFLGLRPARLERCRLCFGSRSKEWKLGSPAYSLSRIELDRLLLDRAAAMGARLTRGESLDARQIRCGEGLVLANGRRRKAPRAGRLFGFKAHFAGPTDEVVELYFTRFGYTGVSAVKQRLTNVCGIAAEEDLRRYGFDFDEFLSADRRISERLRPLSRTMPWVTTGPLLFSTAGGFASANDGVYPAGDALGFVDPFTGSGIFNALLTGRLAGRAAARATPAAEHLRECRSLLGGPFAISNVFRVFVRAHLERLALLVPGNWLYRLTRAAVPGMTDV